MGKVEMIFTFGNYNAVIKEDHSLWIWGGEENEPIKIADMVKDIDIDNFVTDALILKDDNSLWHLNENLELIRSSCDLSELIDIQKVFSSNQFQYALLEDGSLYRVGDVTGKVIISPVLEMENVRTVDTNSSIGYAVSIDGVLKAWATKDPLGGSFDPQGILGVNGLPHVDRALIGGSEGIDTYYYTMILMEDGSLWSFGHNSHGQLGHGTKLHNVSDMNRILEGVAQVSLGRNHCMALMEDGTLLSWGNNSYGQLGNGSSNLIVSPQKIAEGFTAVAAGGVSAYETFDWYAHSIGLDKESDVWSWGNNSFGQLGNVEFDSCSEPVKVFSDVRRISAGHSSSLAIKNDDSLWLWGNKGSETDYSSSLDILQPIKIMDEVEMAAIGTDYERNRIVYILKKDGSLWLYNSGEPSKLLDKEVKYVAAGIKRVMFIKEDNSLWSWKNNFLVKNIETHSTESIFFSNPVKLMDEVLAVSCDSDYIGTGGMALALMLNGDLWGWGDNLPFLIEDGQEVTGEPHFIMSDVVSISCSSKGGAVIKNDATLWIWSAWDNNIQPVQVLDQVISIARTASHFLAVREDGSLWTWGYNKYGELGINSAEFNAKPSPVVFAN